MRLQHCRLPVLVTGPSGTGKELVARGCTTAPSAKRVLCGRQLRRHAPSADPSPSCSGRVKGCLHRCPESQDRQDRGGRWRHPVSRRDRRAATEDQATLLRFFAGAEHRGGGQPPLPQCGCEGHRCHQYRCGAGGGQRRFRMDLYYRLNVVRLRTPACASGPRTSSCLPTISWPKCGETEC